MQLALSSNVSTFYTKIDQIFRYIIHKKVEFTSKNYSYKPHNCNYENNKKKDMYLNLFLTLTVIMIIIAYFISNQKINFSLLNYYTYYYLI